MIFNTTTSRPLATVQAGFGLIELLVSISIMVLVVGIVLVQQSSFNSGALLRSQAYDIGLRLREVQLGSVSAENNSGTGVANFRLSYAVLFTPGSARYEIFSTDATVADTFTPSSMTAMGKTGIIDKRFQIICIQRVPSPNCSTSVADSVFILFKRPNFDAIFFNGSGNILNASVSAVKIRVGVVGGSAADARVIMVSKSGQISVE